jgi:cystathionine gamma-synthase/methionine-gamma-lyase
MDDQKDFDIDTQLVHAGERQDPPIGKPVATPVFATTTFTYDSMEEIDKVFAGEIDGYVYTRHGNPTLTALEVAMRTIEHGATACVFASGMAAVHAALLACEVKTGDTVLASQDLYGATTSLLQNVFNSFGIKTAITDFADIEGVRAKARETKPRVLIAETISNPLLKVCDIDALAEIAREAKARLIIDNTFATPYLCRPLEHGADLVVHSATKYIGGHGDATGGVVISGDEMDKPALVSVLKLVGGVMGVWQAHEIMRGLKTLALRVERSCDNARELANRLAQHERVSRVHFPALAADQSLVKRILRAPHAGALVSIELKEGSREAAFEFMDALKLCVRSTSLGDVFTSVLHPATASHRDLSPARRREWGITDGLVRISVGIENAKDIIADVEQALGSTESRQVGVASGSQQHD